MAAADYEPTGADRVAQARALIVAHAGGFVRSLAAERPGSNLEGWASAVTASVAGVPLLLTANHALDRLEERTLLLELPDRYEPVVTTSAAVSPEADIAVVPLPSAAFSWGLPFLDLDAQAEPELAGDDVEMFVAFGFPTRYTEENRSAQRLELNLINYWGYRAPELHDGLSLSAEDWLLTRFSRKRAYRDGEQQAMRLPHGMSGGGIWCLWGPPNELPTRTRCVLAGILVEYREGKAGCFVAARTHVVEELARRVAEETRESA